MYPPARGGAPLALTSTVYSFDVALSDVDRGVYETLALRVARHPSETMEFLLTRLLAYCHGGMGPRELEQKVLLNFQCYNARREVNDRCFRGGDSGHRQAASEALAAVRQCMDLLTAPRR